jgi:tetratricopeptide (TPR) repeat protein
MPETDHVALADLFAVALAHQQAGRLAQAEALCEDMLARQPDHVDALHLRGVLCIQAGRHDTAIALLERVLARAPELALAHKNLGAAFHAAGRPAAAEASYRRALALAPELAEAHNLLGQLLNEAGRPADALTHLRAAVRLAPDDADAANNLGNALQSLGELPASIRCYHGALERRPDFAICYSNLGSALQRQGHAEAAIANYRAALSLAPDQAIAHGNLAGLLGERGEIAAATAHFERALALAPDSATTTMSLGSMLYDLNRLDEAIETYERALDLRPQFSRARLNLAFALLKRGDFARGWDAYRARWETGELEHVRRRFPGPPWDGADPAGRTVLLYGEQGLGDLIQFCRYLRLLKARGARTILLVDGGWRTLAGLLASLDGVDMLVDDSAALPPFDHHCSVLDLPLRFGTTLETIPAAVPYLAADPARRAFWRARLGASDRLRVGLVWAGGTVFAKEPVRSPRLAPLLRLIERTEVQWIGLQQGDGRRDLEACAMPAGFIDLGPELRDMADTAAVMAELDLVISSCTAPAHLAAALGRPTWIMLPAASDWRWLLGREDSPWYPTARLFRQAARGDWSGVVERLDAALTVWVDRVADRAPIEDSRGDPKAI